MVVLDNQMTALGTVPDDYRMLVPDGYIRVQVLDDF
jgi:hypothetical protein